MRVHILTLFPQAFPGTLGISLIGKAIERGLVELFVYDLKDCVANDMIDDKPFGGSAGMVIKCETINNAIEKHSLQDTYKIFLSPRGYKFSQSIAKAFSMIPKDILILCGRYEGVDQRVLDKWNFHEISLGDFVLCGGEVAALTILEACIRVVPGVVGKNESIENDTFPTNLLEHDQFTKPAIWENRAVPDILLSGDHARVDAYRKAQSLILTHSNRLDLWEKIDI